MRELVNRKSQIPNGSREFPCPKRIGAGILPSLISTIMSVLPFRRVFTMCLAGLGFLFAGNVVYGQTSPVGAWDLVLTGNQRGVINLTFSENGRLEGIGVLTLSTVKSNASGITNLFGSVVILGEWLFEHTNKISGFMNLITEVSTNFTTNGFSFRGTAKPARLNLKAFGFPGQINFRGVPLVETNLVDLDDATSFLGKAKAKGSPFPRLEIFQLTGVMPNFYEVEGGGPGYTFIGHLLLSSQRVAALSQYRGTSSVVPAVATYVGSFNFKTRRGMLKGLDDLHPVIHYQMAPEAP